MRHQSRRKSWVTRGSAFVYRSAAVPALTQPPPTPPRRGLARQPALAEGRLLVGRRRQLPGAGGGRPHLGVDVHVEQERLVGLTACSSAPLKSSRLGDRDRRRRRWPWPSRRSRDCRASCWRPGGTWCRARGRRTCRAGCRGSTTQPKLFQITHTTGMSYSTAVHSTCGTMEKQPSPAIATQGRSGAASLAPSTPRGAEAHAGEAPAS